MFRWALILTVIVTHVVSPFICCCGWRVGMGSHTFTSSAQSSHTKKCCEALAPKKSSSCCCCEAPNGTSCDEKPSEGLTGDSRSSPPPKPTPHCPKCIDPFTPALAADTSEPTSEGGQSLTEFLPLDWQSGSTTLDARGDFIASDPGGGRRLFMTHICHVLRC